MINILRKGLKYLFFLFPYCFVRKFVNNKREKTSVLNYLNSIQEFPKNEPLNNKFNTILSVQGFGYSGSGAVCDLLREVDGITVVAYRDPESFISEETSNTLLNCEVDFIRVAGGLFEIEKLIYSHNIFINDALIKRTIDNFDFFVQRFKGCPESLKIEFARFLDRIIDFRIANIHEDYYNIHLNAFGFNDISRKNIFFLKNMEIQEYRKYARDLLNGFFNIFPNEGILAIDQLLSDMETEIDKKLDYVRNLKVILVQRDPRDIYVFARKRYIEWIPSDVDVFIAWYQAEVSTTFPYVHNNVLNVRFEDMVLNYESTVTQLFSFLELPASVHINKHEEFNPNYSIRNIGLWRTEEAMKADIRKIEDALPDYCYNI